MAAEDYMDFDPDWDREYDAGDFHGGRAHDIANLLSRGRPQGKARAKLVWTTGGGDRMVVPDMEDDHLRNTIAYIRRKMGEWEQTRAQIIRERNRDLGEYRINGALGSQWLTILLEEFTSRGLDVH